MKAIEVKNISHRFGSRTILKDLSFNVEKGHIHGFLGPNGAGKTTTMKIIAGLLNPSHGDIQVNGNIGFLLEDPPLYNDMTVRSYLKFIAKLKRVPPSAIEKSLDYCRINLDLDTVFDRSIENLSKGYKQRVGIAQAIIHMPEIVILDEPTVGLDPYSVIEIRNLILRLKEEHTILLSSHLLHEMGLVCDEVTIISQGTILESGTISNIEKKLSQSSQLIIKTLLDNEEWSEFLRSHSSFNFVEKINDNNTYQFILNGSEDTELYSQLIEKSVELKVKLIGFEQKKSSLEEIFIKVVDK